MNQIYTGRFYLSAIVFSQWRFFYQNFELHRSLRKFVQLISKLSSTPQNQEVDLLQFFPHLKMAF
jgi:hypothetical protein